MAMPASSPLADGCKGRVDPVRAFALLVFCVFALHLPAAQAVPSYARQTQQSCTGCHVGGFGPQLTPFGRQFKLSGYTLKVGDEAQLPLSAMMVESFTHTQKAQSEAPGPHFSRNDNTELEQASLFFAGRLGDHLGAFVQATYEENGRILGWDNAELRYANTVSTAGHSAVWGLTVTNNPTLSDVFNTAPAWQYPYMAPDLAPGAPAAPILFGGLGGQVIGASAYAQIDGAWYIEAGGFRSLSPTFLRHVNADFDGRLSKIAPYLRLAYTWSIWGGNLEAGGFALDAHRQLPGEDAAGNAIALGGPSDHYRDLGLDASYQNFGDGTRTFTLNALYVDERQHLDATFADGGAQHLRNSLQALNINASYWYRNTWGATVGAFADNGSADAVLYGDTRSPNTQGGTVEVDWNPLGQSDSWGAPWANVRVGAQYTFYTRFSGAVRNVDGAGRRASDNNTFFVYLWLAL
jgi:hypothetical protein